MLVSYDAMLVGIEKKRNMFRQAETGVPLNISSLVSLPASLPPSQELHGIVVTACNVRQQFLCSTR